MRSLGGIVAIVATFVLVGCDLVFPLEPPTPDRGEIRFVQRRFKNEANSTKACSVVLPDTHPGALVVLTATHHTLGQVNKVGDDFDNGYVQATKMTWGSAPVTTELYYAKNVVGGSLTATVELSTEVTLCLVYVNEYLGADLDDPLDQASVSLGTTAGATSSGSKSITSPSELIFGHGEGENAVVGIGSGFQERATDGFNAEEDKNVTELGSYDATFNVTGTTTPVAWVAMMATFR